MTYSQPEKIEARRRALSHAVTILTENRQNAAVVNRDYVRAVKEHLLTRGLTTDKSIAAHCNDAAISLWEELWDSHVGPKRAGDLTVAYLSGPEPLNDFRELVALGVHPYNIFAFENEAPIFDKALKSVLDSEFPLLKIHPLSLEAYLHSVPRTFDIIYIDACGPLPSTGQGTLRTVANVFRHNRIASPGVLISNFARPDVSHDDVAKSYSELVANFLYPKDFLEAHDPKWNLTEGPVAHGFIPKSDDADSFLHSVLGDFDNYYGQFVTRLLFDLASVITPWIRIANSEIWKTLFTISPKEAAARATLLKHFSADYDGGDFIVEPGQHPLGWTLAALFNDTEKEPDENYPLLDKASLKLRDRWIDQLSGYPKLSCDARTAIEAFEVLRLGIGEPRPWTPQFADVMERYKYLAKMHLFCDVPTGELAFFPIVAQYAFPMHYNVEQTRRFSYIASGKTTRMFLDVIPFDSCRYLWDWLPTTELVSTSFNLLAQQLVYRFALDGLAKQHLRYNIEYLFGANVVGVQSGRFQERLLRPREML